jgi:hypothetical protein
MPPAGLPVGGISPDKGGSALTTVESTTTVIQEPETPFKFNEAHLAAASFLASACTARPNGKAGV